MPPSLDLSAWQNHSTPQEKLERQEREKRERERDNL